MKFPELSARDFTRKYGNTIVRVDGKIFLVNDVRMEYEEDSEREVTKSAALRGQEWNEQDRMWVSSSIKFSHIKEFNVELPTLGAINFIKNNKITASYFSRRAARQWRRSWCEDTVSAFGGDITSRRLLEDWVVDGVFGKRHKFYTIKEAIPLLNKDKALSVAISPKIILNPRIDNEGKKHITIYYRSMCVGEIDFMGDSGEYIINIVSSADYMKPLLPEDEVINIVGGD